MKKLLAKWGKKRQGLWPFLCCALLLSSALLGVISIVSADVPGRPSPGGPAGAGTSVPEPGNQQQEQPNITFPAPYNVFEFVVTCMACHGGAIDQTAGHGANWAGSNMASATRDPVFRAKQLIFNQTAKTLPGMGDGAGNLCFRCHSPNGWLSGRFDPKLGARADGSDILQSIVLSTDNEGVQCEQCHRAVGAVTMKRADLNQADPAWNMLSGLYDWPHTGGAFTAGPGAGNPYGNATLEYHDGMSYGAKYGGMSETFFSDVPLSGAYTGQTYGVYPWWYTGYVQPPPPGSPATNARGEVIQYNPDGSLPFLTEIGVTPDPLWGAMSPEHMTRESLFVKSPEFCGACHDQTLSAMNKGTPVRRTYTEWKYSSYRTNGVRCQDCHMPTMKHELTDDAPVGVNVDPLLVGFYPMAKNRNPYGGTSFHKFAGANRDLPRMMKVLYPEVDLEVIGGPTGHDPFIFPGMLSDRGPMFDRHVRNTEISLREAVQAEISSGPTYNAGSGRWEIKVKVTNRGGHKLPSGSGDGRRMWVGLVVKNNLGQTVFQSGYYDPATARLYNDSSMAGLTRAQTPAIDGAANAVMIYEKRTGAGNGNGTFTMSPSLLNEQILFDNRIPPLGFTNADYRANGAGFWRFTGPESAAVPSEDLTRYPDGRNWDEITYSFAADAGAVLSARAEVYHQTLSRDFMDYLKDNLNLLEDQAGIPTPRPQGGPNILDPNYPLTPTYLSDSLIATTGVDFITLTDFNGSPLRDNWAGVAYAAWLLAGRGAPFLMAAADTAVAASPGPPGGLNVTQPLDPQTGRTDPNVQLIRWSPVPEADGYVVWVRYGKDTSTPADPAYPLTASWDRLAVVQAPQVELRHVALNPGKTFQYKVQAFNARGVSADSVVVAAQTAPGQPLVPTGLRVAGVTVDTVTLSWYDEADNETDFIIQRQDVPADTNQRFPDFVTIAIVPSATAGPAFGANSFTDSAVLPPGGTRPPGYTYVPLLPGHTYNYQLAALNDFGTSTWTLPPVTATTLGPSPAPTNLTATVINAYRVDLAWTDNSGNELTFRIQRATDAGFTNNVAWFSVGSNVTLFRDRKAAPATTYYYRVYAHNNLGDSSPSNEVTVTTPPVPPAAPTGLSATSSAEGAPLAVLLNWTDNANDETGFKVERATNETFTTGLTTFTINAPDTTNYSDGIVAAGTTYFYRVYAFNANGDSPASNRVLAITRGGVPPQAPAGLTVSQITASSIRLAWTDASTNERSFFIERSRSGLNGWSVVGVAGPNATAYTNTGLAGGTLYYYRVRAWNPSGYSGYSATVSATTK